MLEKYKEWIRLHKQERILLSVAAILFLLFICVLLLVSSTPQPAHPQTVSQANPTPSSSAGSQLTYPAPAVTFTTYTPSAPISSTLPHANGVSAYTFLSNFSNNQILAFARKLGLTDFQTTSTNYDLVTNMTDMHHRGMLLFDHLNGYFVYQSYADTTPPGYTPGMSPSSEALSMIQSLGLADPSLTCPIVYARKDTPFTYVECHRDWGKIGAPILNPVGILNVPMSTPLSSLKEGVVDASTSSPLDTNIINLHVAGVADPQENGYARPNDFNSVTVVITPNGLIHEIDSNLRWLDQVKTQPIPSNQLLTPQVALSRLKNHLSSFSLTIPDGSGSTRWSTIYPNNQATASKAFITDEQLAYIEKPGEASQTNFVPMYVFRGYATLTSGYRVNFVQMEPAMADLTSFMAADMTSSSLTSHLYADVTHLTSLLAQKIHAVIPPVFAQTPSTPNNQLQLKTFALTPTVNPSVPSPTLTVSLTPNPVSTVSQTSGCFTPTQINGSKYRPQDQITINIPQVGTITAFYQAHIYYLINSNLPDNSATGVKAAFYAAVRQQYDINVAKYILQNSSVKTSLTSASAVKDLFPTINSSQLGLTKFQNTLSSCPDYVHATSDQTSNPLEAPLYNCQNHSDYNYDLTRIETNASNVANDIYSAIENNNLGTLASQANLFPQTTLTDFAWVFINQFEDPLETPNASAAQRACYISGESPAIFLYSPVKQNIIVATGAHITYSDPAIMNNFWTVTANPNGTLTENGINYDDLYYEYNPTTVHLTAGNSGYVVKKSQVVAKVNDIAKQVKLNSSETTALVSDVTRSLNTISSSYVKISLASQTELNNYLPLYISPSPDQINRINILLTPENNAFSLPAPLLPVINRQGFTVVEVGARSIL